jgi:anti-anti-sigma regulatory factor
VGLAVLIGAQRRARQLGVSVHLVAPSPAVANLVRSIGLERSFTICQDRFGTLASGLDEPAGPAPVPGDAGRC